MTVLIGMTQQFLDWLTKSPVLVSMGSGIIIANFGAISATTTFLVGSAGSPTPVR
jgi:hypothetical protein